MAYKVASLMLNLYQLIIKQQQVTEMLWQTLVFSQLFSFDRVQFLFQFKLLYICCKCDMLFTCSAAPLNQVSTSGFWSAPEVVQPMLNAVDGGFGCLSHYRVNKAEQRPLTLPPPPTSLCTVYAEQRVLSLLKLSINSQNA